MRDWNGRGTGQAVGGGEINNSDEEEQKSLHPLAKKIERER